MAVFPSEDVTFQGILEVMKVNKHFHAKSWEVLPALVARILDNIMIHPLVHGIFEDGFGLLWVSVTLSHLVVSSIGSNLSGLFSFCDFLLFIFPFR